MKFEILINSIFRLPMAKALEKVNEYESKGGFKRFDEQQKVFDILAERKNVRDSIKDEAIEEAALYFHFLSKGKNLWSLEAFECLKKFPNVIWIEMIGFLKPDEIMIILRDFCKELMPVLVETFIINLPESLQIRAIELYKERIAEDRDMFENFYFSLESSGRLKLEELFRERVPKTALLELEDLEEKKVDEVLEKEHEAISRLESDKLVEFVLLKGQYAETLYNFIRLYKKKLDECSIQLFKLFITRCKYLVRKAQYRNVDFDDEETEPVVFSDMELIKLFKHRFYELGLEEVLSIFCQKENYGYNAFVADVVMEFLDIATDEQDALGYVNDETKTRLIRRVASECEKREYTLEDFEHAVKGIGAKGPKLVYDDYIEAIVACGKLLRTNVINDKHSLFLELREKFIADLFGRCEKDGTFNQVYSLNGVFYRLAKGTIPFEKVYMTKTYRGLIYLAKCGTIVDDGDYVTKYLSDAQLAKLNISPVLKWRATIERNREEIKPEFVSRMGLQLLCLFGIERTRYLLESDMQNNRLENLFDGINYKNISIDEKGQPILNVRLGDYLFGRGLMSEENSVINRLVRNSIPEFGKVFCEFCNNFDDVMVKCNGLLSIKRIVNLFECEELPIELKPDEIEFKLALREMSTHNVDLLRDAIGLCKDARNRTYSTIPMITGTLGDFTYKMLRLDDSLAVAVGNLSHCCFVVQGASDSTLRHAMQSVNGRVFVVYHKGKFLTQSWVWRNGDVVCFDSVEAGSPYHEKYDDEFNLLDVYKMVAREIIDVSASRESAVQRVKVVTVGKSDFKFEGLAYIDSPVPRPLEKNLYVYDSSRQRVLAGAMPKEPRYGVVGIQYFDVRKKPKILDVTNSVDIDVADEIMVGINALRYRIHQEEIPATFSDYTRIILGDGWYILVGKDGEIENGCVKTDEDTVTEYDRYLKLHGKNMENEDKGFVKKFTPLAGLQMKGE